MIKVKNVVKTQNGWTTASHDYFLNKVVKRFKHIRVGVIGDKEPFAYTYFRVSKKEVIELVKINQCEVRYSIELYSKVQIGLEDILFINKVTSIIK